MEVIDGALIFHGTFKEEMYTSVIEDILTIQKKGGPDEQDLEFCEGIMGRLGQSLTEYEWIPPSLLSPLSYAAAVLSFRPCGVHCFGLYFLSSKDSYETGNDQP